MARYFDVHPDNPQPRTIGQVVELIRADGLIAYKYVVLPYLFLSDTWVQAVEIRPDNPKVLHHANLAYLKAGSGFRMDNFITGTVPGGEAMTLEKGVGYKIPAGSLLVLRAVPGSAHAIAAAVDRCRWPDVVGSIAGDDTVFLAFADRAALQRIRQRLTRLARG